MQFKFQQLQKDFCYKLRHGISDQKQMQIYIDQYYLNTNERLTNCFPILSSIMPPDLWQSIIKEFCRNYSAKTPLFNFFSDEFLQFLHTRPTNKNDLPFLFELAHFEWMEAALDHAEDIIFPALPDLFDMNTIRFIKSPLTEVVAYHYPVHQINLNFIPNKPNDEPVFLAIYRDRADQVNFIQLNTTAARLLHILQEKPLTAISALQQLAKEMNLSYDANFYSNHQDLIKQWILTDILICR